MKHRAKTLLFGLAGLSLLTSGLPSEALSASVAQAQSADQGIPLVCRPPEAGETPNAYIPTSQNAGVAAQGRMVSPQATARQGINPPANSPARLPASPMPAPAAVPTAADNTGVAASSAANVANSAANQPMNQLSREVQTGSQYRICPPPTMPSTVPSTQLYAVPFAVAAAWECYGPREMAYTPRPWRGPDPAVHSPLPVKPTRAATSQKAKPQAATNTAKPEAAVTGTLPGMEGHAPSASAVPAVGQLPVPTVGAVGAAGAVSTGGNPLQNGAATGNRQNGNGNGGNAGYRPTVMGSGSVAAPLIATSAPTAPPQIQSQTPPNSLTNTSPQSNGQNGGQPYSGAAANVAPSRDIVDTGETGTNGSAGARMAQAPVSLLDAPPLTPNPMPSPSGFTPR